MGLYVRHVGYRILAGTGNLGVATQVQYGVCLPHRGPQALGYESLGTSRYRLPDAHPHGRTSRCSVVGADR
jgi:hypothetical protein